MFAEVGIVAVEDLLLKPSRFGKAGTLLVCANDFGHAPRDEIFLQVALKRVGKGCEVIHLCVFKRVGQRVAR